VGFTDRTMGFTDRTMGFTDRTMGFTDRTMGFTHRYVLAPLQGYRMEAFLGVIPWHRVTLYENKTSINTTTKKR
jgi:hypothetical protein